MRVKTFEAWWAVNSAALGCTYAKAETIWNAALSAVPAGEVVGDKGCQEWCENYSVRCSWCRRTQPTRPDYYKDKRLSVPEKGAI
jgi:hypothetical protein